MKKNDIYAHTIFFLLKASNFTQYSNCFSTKRKTLANTCQSNYQIHVSMKPAIFVSMIIFGCKQSILSMFENIDV